MNYTPDRQDPPNILLVDDTPNNLRLLSSLLGKQGYKVRSVINGMMALKAASAKPPDLILLDINMPEMNGYEVCEKLKANETTRSIPVIFLSALDDVLDKVKAFEVGGCDYITKPFQIEEVVVRVENQLQLRQAQRMLSEQNVLLEQEICDRKRIQASLEAREVELQQALNEIKSTQMQLVQKEKMASLGQLVAGIAHEINNPISFIYGNVTYANDYFLSLVNVLRIYQEHYPKPLPAVENAIEDIDLDFVVEDLGKLMNSMQTGVERIHAIVLGLRIFSRLDEAAIKAVNLHEGIDSTLLVIQYRLQATNNRPAIEAIANYGDLPKVTCSSGQLNQVFLHLIENAIDALDSRYLDPNLDPSIVPTIQISTKSIDDNRVQICFTDNGIGIPEEITNRIFDPFFTTKNVGQGTGLGLSICYQIIVEQHQGELRYEALPGGGSQFIIEIPVYRE
ncbi:response regulator [Roseofilum sp. BLCC_M143]|uniref:histidine kinase n=2 Tax=Roseofilum TaxID=1233426 RepID=A0ABT7BX99_9CYAN|nr:response regulator [Roseofilum casamattae BLCC-M143]